MLKISQRATTLTSTTLVLVGTEPFAGQIIFRGKTIGIASAQVDYLHRVAIPLIGSAEEWWRNDANIQLDSGASYVHDVMSDRCR